MDTENTRFWPRVGMYVTMEFAEEWIERMSGAEDKAGRYLSDDLEEFDDAPVVSDVQLRKEITNLFENPFQEGELSPDIQAIVLAQQVQSNKINRVKELKKEGYSTDEAKEMWQEEMDLAITQTLGLEPGSLAIKMGVEGEEEEELQSSEVSLDGAEEE